MDVLQLIGVTLIVLQLLVLVARTRRVFMVAAFAAAVTLIAASPAAWQTDWTMLMPLPLAAYFSPATGSLFPLFPWAAYVFVGAAAGLLYARWGAAHLVSFARWGMLAPGSLLIVAGMVVWSGIPGDVAIRTGVCGLILGLIAIVSRHVSHLPHVFGAVAQESLVVYFVHLCIVYGSIWNPGLARFYGGRLDPASHGRCGFRGRDGDDRARLALEPPEARPTAHRAMGIAGSWRLSRGTTPLNSPE